MPEVLSAGTMSASGFALQNVQNAPVPIGTRSATDVPTTCLVSPPLSRASANISSTQPTHANDANHVGVGTLSSLRK